MSYRGDPPPCLPLQPGASLGQGLELQWGGAYQGEEGHSKLEKAWQGSGRQTSEVRGMLPVGTGSGWTLPREVDCQSLVMTY